MALTSAGTLTATGMTAFDLSSAVAFGSTYAYILFQNINGFPVRIHYGQAGTSDDIPLSLAPGDYTPPIKITLTSARTVNAYIEGGGSATVWVESYGGTGLSPATITVSDIATWLTMHGYTVGTGGDLTNAQVQVLIDSTNSQVSPAATNYQNITGFALNMSLKNDIIIKGTVAQALYAIRNKGAASGLMQQREIVAEATASKLQAEFEKAIDNMNKGLNLGA